MKPSARFHPWRLGLSLGLLAGAAAALLEAFAAEAPGAGPAGRRPGPAAPSGSPARAEPRTRTADGPL